MARIRIELDDEAMRIIEKIKDDIGSEHNAVALTHALKFYNESKVMEENKFVSSELALTIEEIVDSKIDRVMSVLYSTAVDTKILKSIIQYEIMLDKMGIEIDDFMLDSYRGEAAKQLKLDKQKLSRDI